MSDDVMETRDRFTCPRCGAFSHHARLPIHVWVSRGGSRSYVPVNDEHGWYGVIGTDVVSKTQSTPEIQWVASVCVSCEQVAMWRGLSLIHPRTSTAPPPHADMPDKARELYEEARLVLPDSRRAAAALARAALESFLRELDDSGKRKNLQTRIAELKGKINEPLWQVLTALRVVGNDSLHDDTDDLVVMYLSGEDSGLVEAVFGSLNALVEELVTLPKKARELYEMIPESKRTAAERAPR